MRLVSLSTNGPVRLTVCLSMALHKRKISQLALNTTKFFLVTVMGWRCLPFSAKTERRACQCCHFTRVGLPSRLFYHKQPLHSIPRLSAPSCHLLGKINAMGTFFSMISMRHLCLKSKWLDVLQRRMFPQHSQAVYCFIFLFLLRLTK